MSHPPSWSVAREGTGIHVQRGGPGGSSHHRRGLFAFRRAIGRLTAVSQRDFKQCFNVFTREERDQFHMRHAELHLSFIVPAEEV